MGWSGRGVLVTGATGFIGGHLVERLVREGARVRAFVRYNSQRTADGLDPLAPDVRGDVEVVRGTILEPEAVAAACRGAECVFHLAAVVPIPYSYHRPREVLETNAVGTLNVLNAARQHGVARVVVTSTSEVYGTARYVPIDEQHPLQAQSPYAASKIASDKLAESYHLSYDLPVAIIRPFNTYGPRQSLRAVIPTIIAQALFREVVALGDLTPTRDFLFVEDTVSGFLCVGESAEAVGRVVNVGSGQEIAIGDVAQTVLALTGSRARVVREDVRVRPGASEVRRLCADTRLARERLGWAPRIALQEGLRRTIDWVAASVDPRKAVLYHY
ncbi:MAG: GDP-mannose 4,6-dehydratase [Armatimonadetes bacterium]|nr:GDP-mannose 4,6-dehydratase [Armatimonadota bacterium]